jgi:hypothetical protein
MDLAWDAINHFTGSAEDFVLWTSSGLSRTAVVSVFTCQLLRSLHGHRLAEVVFEGHLGGGRFRSSLR